MRQRSETTSTLAVLLVDDEKEFALYTAKRLRARGIHADVVHDGEAAVTMATNRTYDVIVLDVLMPGMDGLQTLRSLRQRLPLLPAVLMLTGHGTEEMAREAISLGAREILLKPCDLPTLMQAIAAAHEAMIPTADGR